MERVTAGEFRAEETMTNDRRTDELDDHRSAAPPAELAETDGFDFQFGELQMDALEDEALDSETSDHDRRLALVLASLTDRVQKGELVDFAVLCAEHPDLVEDLRILWGTMNVAHVAGQHDSSRQRSQSEGGGSDSAHGSSRCRCNSGLRVDRGTRARRNGSGVPRAAAQFGSRCGGKDDLARASGIGSGPTSLLRRSRSDRSVAHPGIVPVYEFGEFEGRPFFSMQLVEGVTLSQMIATGPLSPRECVRLLIPICRAVDYAHQQGYFASRYQTVEYLDRPIGSRAVSGFRFGQARGGARVVDADRLPFWGRQLI